MKLSDIQNFVIKVEKNLTAIVDWKTNQQGVHFLGKFETFFTDIFNIFTWNNVNLKKEIVREK